MARYGMLINTKKCIGCYACRVACQRQNDLLPTQDFIRYEEHETGTYPNVAIETVPLQCMHCEDAPCAAVCPTGAAYIGADGIVGVDEGRCIGCKYCMAACPYGARIQIKKTGVIEKCRFCWYEGEPGNPPRCVAPASPALACLATWTIRRARSARKSLAPMPSRWRAT